MGILFLVAIGYIIVKYVLPWVNDQLDTEFKWWQVPIALLVGLIGLYALVMKRDRTINRNVANRHSQYRKLSDSELEYLMYNGNSLDEKRSARMILEERIQKRKTMWHK